MSVLYLSNNILRSAQICVKVNIKTSISTIDFNINFTLIQNSYYDRSKYTHYHPILINK